jgi:endo-1,4-beta-xylanase
MKPIPSALATRIIKTQKHSTVSGWLINVTLITLALFGVSRHSFAQEDAYHSEIRATLESTYNIKGGTWVFAPNELDNHKAMYAGSGIRSNIDIPVLTISKATQLIVTSVPQNPWQACFALNSKQALAAGDKLLLIFWARTISAPNNVGMVNFTFMESGKPYFKFRTFEQRIGTTWKQYMIPMEITKDKAAGDTKFIAEVGVALQTIQIAGVTALNFKQSYALKELPVQSHDEYAGMELDAPWRVAAEARIEQIRKANLELTVLGSDGKPAPNTPVKIEMLRHEYAFGTSIQEQRLVESNDNYNKTYVSKLFNLDGKGHGFNTVVLENGHKWNQWENKWPLSNEINTELMKRLTARGIEVRGHNLVWPSWRNSPSDIGQNKADLKYLKKRIDNRLIEMLSSSDLSNVIKEWDVINEPTGNTDFADAFKGTPGYATGRELYVDIFQKVKALNPKVRAYINEAHITNFYAKNDVFKSIVTDIVKGGGVIDGVGFQAHFRYMIPPEEMLRHYEEYHQITGGKIRITEYDNETLAPDALHAAYFRDLLIATFSYPHSDGFLMWGFWDGTSRKAPLFDINWNLKPGGQPFIDLVFNKWWTPTTTLTSNAEGKVTLRGFKGDYKVTVGSGKDQFIGKVKLSKDTQLDFKLSAVK